MNKHAMKCSWVTATMAIFVTLSGNPVAGQNGPSYRQLPAQGTVLTKDTQQPPPAIDWQSIPDREKQFLSTALMAAGGQLADVDWSQVPAEFEAFTMPVRANSGAVAKLRAGDAVSILSCPASQKEDNRRLVLVIPDAKLFAIRRHPDPNYQIAVLLVPKGRQYSVDDEDMGQLHMVSRLAVGQ